MSAAHDWKRYDMDWYICAICGSRISILADFEKTKYGCAGPLHIPEKAQFTAVDMANAAADGFRDGAASVVVELPEVPAASFDPLFAFAYAQKCREAIIAAGGRVKHD